MYTVEKFFESMTEPEIAKGMYDLFEDIDLPEQIDGVKLTGAKDMTFKQMTELRRGLETDAGDYETALMIGTVMLGSNVAAWSYKDYLPYMLSVLKYVHNSVKNESVKLKYNPTADEKKAGIDKLSVFREWGTVDAIVRSRPCYTHEDVYNLKYVDVFVMQWIDLEHSKFERKLMKIQSEK